jgi:hypothetical protein
MSIGTFQCNKQIGGRHGQTLEVVVLPIIEVLPPKYGHIYIMSFGPPPSTKQYKVKIGNFCTCTCVEFITMMASSLGGRGRGCITNTFISSCKM